MLLQRLSCLLLLPLAPTQRPASPPPRADPDVEAWVQLLAQRITDPNEAIRRSARQALWTMDRIEEGEPHGFRPPPPRPLLDALDRLDLTAEQRKAVEPIRAEHESKARDAHRQLIQETLGRLRTVLSPDQYSRVEEFALREPPPHPHGPFSR